MPAPIPPLARTFQLPNGLRVLHVPRPASAVTGLALSFGVGSRHERPEQRGLSHLLEHLAFTGTARWTETQLRDQIAARGGVTNAYTSAEQTVYWTVLPAGELAAGLDYLRQLGFEPTLRGEPLTRERRIVEAEAGQVEVRWSLRLGDWLAQHRVGLAPAQALNALLHPDPDCQAPAIGYPWTRRSLGLADVHAHHHRYYTTRNAQLIVLGGGSTRAVGALALAAFGDLPERAAPAPLPPWPAPQGRGERHRLHELAGESELEIVVGLPFGGLADPDWPIIDLLRFLIQDVLQERLRTELGLLYQVEVGFRTGPDFGWLRVRVSVPAESRARIERELTEQLDQLQAGEVDPAVWARVAAEARGRWQVTMEGPADYLHWLAQHAAVLEREPAGPWPARAATLDLAEGRRVLGRLLDRENRILVVQETSWPLTVLVWLAAAVVGLGGLAGLGFLVQLARAAWAP